MRQEERVAELVLRLEEMAQEAFAKECEAVDQERNMAVLASALVRAGVKVMVAFCPREKLGEAMASLVGQINQGLRAELGPLPGEGTAANEPMSGGTEGSVASQVEGEVGEPQNQPEK
jgi:hypothetical protein